MMPRVPQEITAALGELRASFLLAVARKRRVPLRASRAKRMIHRAGFVQAFTELMRWQPSKPIVERLLSLVGRVPGRGVGAEQGRGADR